MTADRNFRRSPLHGLRDRLAATGGAVTVAETPFLAQINVRTDALALARPGDVDVLPLGPDEFLVVGPPGSEDRLIAAFDGPGVSVVDVSAQRTALDLSGPGVRELLAFGCSIDLHPRVFAVGDCAQTVLAHTPVVLQRRESGFRVLVRSSFAAHLAAWILDASPELTAGH
ncbi:sarcosine oxidase subunit gamma [Actinoplanes sp. CA-252034]|uniref:sarcosine oxidase subunit gamma n=1 Tax=Actinoplanes sp. CA-252034 TaxID=3239906 RepID=UPI003D95EF70